MAELPILDPAPLRDLLELGDTRELVQELVEIFKGDVPVQLARLQAALEAGHVDETLQEAHGLKGALGNMGLRRFAELASRIEISAKEGRLDEAARVNAALPAAFEEALLALNATFPSA